jgi:hypothetical protein
MSSFVTAVSEQIERSMRGMTPVWAVLDGSMPDATLRRLAALHHAEIRTFLDLKLPERMRVCPREAVEVRKFFAEEYVEEHGNFVPGRDHGSLWGRLCEALGVERDTLEGAYVTQMRKFEYLRALEPSHEAMVRELATMAGWESVAPRFATPLVHALAQRYALPAESLEFFALHETVDVAHSATALRLLDAFASTPSLREVALHAVSTSLTLRDYGD